MGGNAFSNVKPIKKEHIEETFESIKAKVPIGPHSKLLGSAGKKPVSGDLDIAVPFESKDNQQRLLRILKDVINDHDVRKFSGNISFPWKVPATGDNVQVDFIFGNPVWLSFYYHSSGDSVLKGTHRNTAISALAAETDREELSDEVNPDGVCVDVIRWKWSSKTGLTKVRRKFKKRKDGNGYTKTSNEEVLKGPYYEPWQVSSILFNNMCDDKYLDSGESVIEAVGVVYAKDKEKRDRIYKRIAKNFSEHHDIGKKQWDYPAEIKPYIK